MSIENQLANIESLMRKILIELRKANGSPEIAEYEKEISEDDLFEEVKEMVINSGKASTAYLQRRLSIGYGRAARLMDMLEEANIIGSVNGSSPREVLISPKQYQSTIDN